MSLISKGAVGLGMAALFVAFPVQATETNPVPLIAQNNPFNNIDDGYNSVMIDMIRLLDSAQAAMKSNDPEVKRMATETYNMALQQLHGMMTMWMKKNPIRNMSPR